MRTEQHYLIIIKIYVMAKVEGLFLVRKAVRGRTYQKQVGKYYVRNKKSVQGESNESTRLFNRTRQHMMEIAQAARFSNCLQTALHDQLFQPADAELQERLTQQLVTVIKKDRLNPVGFRNIADAGVGLLKGLSFYGNEAASLLHYRSRIDRRSGNMELIVDRLEYGGIKFSLARIRAMALRMDRDGRRATCCVSGPVRIDNEEVWPIVLKPALPANAEQTLLLVMGVELFYGDGHSSHRNAANSLRDLVIVDADPLHHH